MIRCDSFSELPGIHLEVGTSWRTVRIAMLIKFNKEEGKEGEGKEKRRKVPPVESTRETRVDSSQTESTESRRLNRLEHKLGIPSYLEVATWSGTSAPFERAPK